MERREDRFKQIQIKRIEIDKWYEGEKKKRDPGAEYVFNWIGTRAPSFRQQWEESKCQSCSKWRMCGHSVKTDCSDFNQAQ
jgi:hypothetical protein